MDWLSGGGRDEIISDPIWKIYQQSTDLKELFRHDMEIVVKSHSVAVSTSTYPSPDSHQIHFSLNAYSNINTNFRCIYAKLLF